MRTEASRAQTGDVFLEDWVTLANDYNLQVAVTLMMSGILVSGTITSGAEFLEHIGKSIYAAAEIDHEALGKTVEKHYLEVAKKLYPQMPPLSDKDAPRALEGTAPRKSYFIHLKDVNILGSRLVPTVPYWRGRLDRVDGWFIGGLKEAPSK